MATTISRLARHSSLFWTMIDPAERTLRLGGELDATGTERVADSAARLGFARETMTVNIAGLTFIGAAGLGALVELQNRQTHAGGPMHVVHASDWITRVFSIGGLSGLLRA